MNPRRETQLYPGHGLVLVERPGGGRALPHAVRFRHLRLRRAERSLSVAAHRHDIYEILIILAGSYRCRIDGQAHGAEAGEVLVVRPGEVHEDGSPGPLRLAAVACEVDPPLVWPDGRRCFPLPGAAALVEAFSDEPDDAWAAEIHDLRCRGLLLALLRQAAPPEPEDAFRSALLRRLDQRLARPLDLDALARELGVSRRTLSARCRAVCATSPARLLARLRLERARALLHETSLPVKAVAVRCGFANPNHFSTTFRRAFGRPPREEGPLPAQ